MRRKGSKMGDSITLNSGFVLDYTNMFGKNRIQSADIDGLQDKIRAAAAAVARLRRTGQSLSSLQGGAQYASVRFVQLPFVKEGNPTTPAMLEQLHAYSRKLWSTTDAVLFLGIGGSYLGSKVIFDVQAGDYWNQRDNKSRGGYPMVYFSGNNLDADQYRDLLLELVRKAKSKHYNGLGKMSITLVPVSKSGTTLELTAALIYFYDSLMENAELFDVFGCAVTDLQDEANVLKQFAVSKGWELFDIQEGVGGRFSVLSSPGLLTAAVVGMKFEELLRGAADMEAACQSEDVYANPALMNAALKYLASESYGCDIEVFMPYSMRLKTLSEWYVQLLAESLGKRHDRNGQEVFYGRTPIAAVGTTDMHAQTQQHQDGRRNKVVQFLEVMDKSAVLTLQVRDQAVSAYQKYNGMNIDMAQRIAMDANAQALNEDDRFNAKYILPQLTPYYLGQIFYFLMLSIAYEGEIANVNAFDQPGVEAYKRIMKQSL